MTAQLACPECEAKFRVPAKAFATKGRTVRCAKCQHKWLATAEDLIPLDDTPTPEKTEPEPPTDSAEPDDSNTDEPTNSVSEAESLASSKEDISDADDDFDMSGDAKPKKSKKAKKSKKQKAKKAGNDNQKTTTIRLVASLSAMSLLLICTAFFSWRDSIRNSMPFTDSIYNAMGYFNTDDLKLAALSIARLNLGNKNRYSINGSVVNLGEETSTIPVVRIRLVDREKNTLKMWEFSQEGDIEPGGSLNFDAPKLDSRYLKKEHAFIVDIGNPLELSMRD